jgi:hypothetical protein
VGEEVTVLEVGSTQSRAHQNFRSQGTCQKKSAEFFLKKASSKVKSDLDHLGNVTSRASERKN